MTSGVDHREVAKLLELSHFFHYNLVGEQRIDYHFAMFLLLMFVYVDNLSLVPSLGRLVHKKNKHLSPTHFLFCFRSVYNGRSSSAVAKV